jgi:penicillin-insensitive murein endopeptidase
MPGRRAFVRFGRPHHSTARLVRRHPATGLALSLVAFIAIAGAGCAELGMISDGGSVSRGRTNGGRIVEPAAIPDEGDGFRTPFIWRSRGYRYGTDELVDLIVGAGRRVAAALPGGTLAVADLSPLRGGRSRQHQSHQSGRDVDLLFYVTDPVGVPMNVEVMRRFGPGGVSTDDRWVKGTPLRFDVARNWELVKALLTAPEAEVQYIFLYEPLAILLLDHARASGEPDSMVELARSALLQPGDSAPHDDHFHVRIFCSESDSNLGCVDRGTRVATRKKGVAPGVLPEPLRTALAPMPAMLALVGRP